MQRKREGTRPGSDQVSYPDSYLMAQMKPPEKILIIQTASIGDVILSTPVAESLHSSFPSARVDFLLKKGNEPLFKGHPFIEKIYAWDKSHHKYGNFFRLLGQVRTESYDLVINVQRYFLTGLLTVFSGGKIRVGFDKNPLSFAFDIKISHRMGSESVHEVDRNLDLVKGFTGETVRKVRLYPRPEDVQKVSGMKAKPYICMAPASLWHTKQYPVEKWGDFLKGIGPEKNVYLIGGPADISVCDRIIALSGNTNAVNLSGKLGLLETASLMKDARMNFVNDSAPLHLASSMNAPVTAVFCSTVPAFGFGPLSHDAIVIETSKQLACRPCGIHGLRKCPEGHFECATTIDNQQLHARL